MTPSEQARSASTPGKVRDLNLPIVSTISESRPLARTLHTCTVCGLPITVGSQYSKHVLCNHDSLDSKKRIVTIRWHLPFCPETPQ